MSGRFDCTQVERRLWEYLDGALPAEEAAAVRAHLMGCRGCGPACRCCRAFLALVARSGAAAGEAPGELRARIRARLAEPV
ncbi:MAG TPA: zf-HC2 domain-containing protein [Gemmatimonadales bacterium]|nr:zf-HC2 domain-containing protein [Gemmatimonadales bacterium]